MQAQFIMNMLNDQLKQGKNFYNSNQMREVKTPQRTTQSPGLLDKSNEIPPLKVGLIGLNKV